MDHQVKALLAPLSTPAVRERVVAEATGLDLVYLLVGADHPKGALERVDLDHALGSCSRCVDPKQATVRVQVEHGPERLELTDRQPLRP